MGTAAVAFVSTAFVEIEVVFAAEAVVSVLAAVVGGGVVCVVISVVSAVAAVVITILVSSKLFLFSREGRSFQTPKQTSTAAQSPEAVRDIRLIRIARIRLRSRMASTSFVTISAISL